MIDEKAAEIVGIESRTAGSLSALVLALDAGATIRTPTRYVGVLSGAACFSGFVCCGRVAGYGAS